MVNKMLDIIKKDMKIKTELKCCKETRRVRKKATGAIGGVEHLPNEEWLGPPSLEKVEKEVEFGAAIH